MTEEASAADSKVSRRGGYALEEWLARLPEKLSAALGGILKVPVRVKLTQRRGQSRGEFLASIPDGGRRVRLTTRGEGLAVHLDVPIQTAFGVVDRLLGGSPGGTFVPNRPLTAIEQRVLRRFAAAVAVALAEAWPGSPRPEFQVEGPCGEAPAEADDRQTPATVATFSLSAGPWDGSVRLCIPLAIAQAAEGPCEPSVPAAGEAPQEAIEVSVDVEGPAVTPEELAGLASNDIVITDTPADGEVIVRLGGTARFAARLGVSGGKRAITITRRLDEAGEA